VTALAPAAFELTIGGLRFVAEPPPGLRLYEDDPTYRDFTGPTRALPGEIELPVRLELGGLPAFDDLPILFDTGTWSLHQAGEETLLRLRGGGESGPFLWLAWIGGGVEPAVRVRCGPALVDGGRLRSPLHYPLDQLLAMYFLAPRHGLICHAAGLVHDGRGILFAGRSGAGKTTWMRLCAARTEIAGLSDDRVIVRRVDGAVWVYGTPWAGEGRVASNRAAPLHALVFLHQSPVDELRPISPGAALEQLLPVVSVLWFDRERMERTTAFCGELVETLPSYELHFRREAPAVEMVEQIR
jgi:hypothetical protein